MSCSRFQMGQISLDLQSKKGPFQYGGRVAVRPYLATMAPPRPAQFPRNFDTENDSCLFVSGAGDCRTYLSWSFIIVLNKRMICHFQLFKPELDAFLE